MVLEHSESCVQKHGYGGSDKMVMIARRNHGRGAKIVLVIRTISLHHEHGMVSDCLN